ncbi:site-specific integrase [Marine Group I thaumarchaeote]|uniref:Site-specific integrase n=1 Tax=Marine Group I thaumarchaeote TaxID=2511932 RepID=A0A7K4NLT3_9ARCH|nr:site-specific integrase [Marine Group I thaumarchaeote]
MVKSSSIRDIPMQRSIVLYYSAIKSEQTKKTYTFVLNKFREYFIIKDYDSLVSIGSKKIQVMIEDYVLYLRSKNSSYGSIHNVICSLKLFFSMNDIVCNWVKINKMKPERKKLRGDKPYTTEDLRIILKQVSNSPLWNSLIHFMASSGVRDGFSEELRIKDLQDMKNGCKSVKVYADSKDEYYTFIHQEAVIALEEYFAYRRKKGEKLSPDSWVFTTALNPQRPMTTGLISAWLTEIVKKTSVNRGEKINGRYDIMIVYGIRKRFDTILKSNSKINVNIAEKIFAHSVSIPLDNHYFKPTLEVMFDEYQKAIPDLVIDQTMKLKLELEKKNKQLSSLEVKDRRIEQLENVCSELKINLNELNSKLS